MPFNKNIQQQINEALQSIDGIAPASPRPYLLTRIQARLSSIAAQSSWETIAQFISRPVVMVASVVFLLSLNLSILVVNHSAKNNADEERQSTLVVEDDFYTAMMAIDNIENTEQ